MKRTDPFLLTDDEFDELQRLISTYHREARRCREGKAYFAGFVLLAAALEASLMGMVQCFPQKAKAAPSCPKTRSHPRPLRKWTLAQLLSVANDLAWLPAKLDRHGEFDHKSAAIGDYAEVVHQLRNLVHPTRYLEDMPRKRITKKYLGLVEDVLEVAGNYLAKQIVASIEQRLQDDE